MGAGYFSLDDAQISSLKSCNLETENLKILLYVKCPLWIEKREVQRREVTAPCCSNRTTEEDQEKVSLNCKQWL